MSTTTARKAPQPTPETPLYPYGDYLADVDGFLYLPTGEPDILDGRHATIEAIEAEADYWATHPMRPKHSNVATSEGHTGAYTGPL